MGRDFQPGEPDKFLGLRDHARYLSRIERGQIADPTPESGRVQVQGIMLGFSSPATIPALWFSATPIDPTDQDSKPRTAWGRYMPMGYEYVNVGFRNDNMPVILGYDITATAKENETMAGYEQLINARDSGVTAYSAFKDLKPGEFDFKSVGNAYISGSDAGTLFLAGNQAFIRLNGPDYRIEAKSSEYHYVSETSELRLGTVFRKLSISDQQEQPVPNGGGTYKEFLIDLNNSNPLTGTKISPSKAFIHFGDILDDALLSPKQSESNKNLRGIISTGDLQETFRLEIDAAGNIIWNQDLGGTDGLKMGASQFLFNATGNSNATGGVINITNSNINLGNSANAANKAVLWSPGLKEELDRIKADISRLADNLKRHRHPANKYLLGIPTGQRLQTTEIKFTGNIDAGFTDLDPDNLGGTIKPGSGPMDVGAKEEDFNMNTIDTLKPEELGGFFLPGSDPGDASSNIVNIES